MELKLERCPVTQRVLSVGQLADAVCTAAVTSDDGYIMKGHVEVHASSEYLERKQGLSYLDGAEKRVYRSRTCW